MPEDEVTPALAPAKLHPFPLLSPLALPSKGLRRPEPAYPDAFELDGPLSPTGKAAASALCVLSGGRPKATAPPALLNTKRSGSEEEDERTSKRIRSSRCGTCMNCLRSDCGNCVNCGDKPKFGGPGVKKQACTARKCLCPNRALSFHDDDDDE